MSFSYATDDEWDTFWREHDEQVSDFVAAHARLEDKELADRIYEGFYTEDYDQFA